MHDPYDPGLRMALGQMSDAEIEAIRERFERPHPPTDFKEDILLFIFTALLFAIGAVIWFSVQQIGSFIVANRIETQVYSAFALCLLIAAVLFYRLKCRHPLTYGLAEIAFGVASIFYASRGILLFLIQGPGSNALGQTDTVVSLVAGLYIIVRGLSNIEDALFGKPTKLPTSRMQKLWAQLFYRQPTAKPIRPEIAPAAGQLSD
jgi:hypothetical protein